MNTTLQQNRHALFANLPAAEQAIDRLVALGIPLDTIHTVGALERGHLGSFADTGAHHHTADRDSVGSFADTEADDHTADRDSVGSFADTEADDHTADRDSVGSFASGDARLVARAERASELLAAGLSPADAEAVAPHLVSGAVLVSVQVRPDQSDAVAGALQQ